MLENGDDTVTLFGQVNPYAQVSCQMYNLHFENFMLKEENAQSCSI